MSRRGPASGRVAPARCIGRRAWLRIGTGLLLTLLAGRVPGATKDRKLPKSAVAYQDHPFGLRDCADCVHFIAAANPAAPGQCSVVAGPVAPRGYCMVWAPLNPPSTGAEHLWKNPELLVHILAGGVRGAIAGRGHPPNRSVVQEPNRIGMLWNTLPSRAGLRYPCNYGAYIHTCMNDSAPDVA